MPPPAQAVLTVRSLRSLPMPLPDTMHIPLPALPLAAAGNERPQATGPILHFAVMHRKPFAVVPFGSSRTGGRRTAGG